MKDILALISKTADAVFAIDREQRLVFWNDAAATLIGLSAQETLGKFCYEVLAGRDESGQLICQGNCGSLINALCQELVPTRDIVVRTKAGQEVWLNLSTVVVPSRWHDLFVLIHLFRDVSREKEAQRIVQQILSIAGKLSLTPGTDPLIRSPLPPTSDLTGRERQVLRLLASGASNKAIAKRLFISPSTVRNHVHNILTELNVRSRLEAVTLALRSGLV